MKRSGREVRGVRPEAGRESMVGKICERGRSWGGSERKRQGVIDSESDELTEWGYVVGAWTGRTETGTEMRLTERTEVDSRDKVRRTGRSDQLYVARMMLVERAARLTRDEERVLRGGWTEMRWWRYGGWVVVRTLQVSERSLYSMRSVILSQWRERKTGVIVTGF